MKIIVLLVSYFNNNDSSLRYNQIIFLPDFKLYFVPLMHPELGNSYVLTFYLTVLKGKNNDDDSNLTKLYGIHKFDNLQFSFNVNENYENKGCVGQ